MLLLGWLVATVIASPRFNPNWSRLPAGTEIPELRAYTTRTYTNGDGTFAVDIAPMQAGGADSQDSCQPTSAGWIQYWWDGHTYYHRNWPEMHYNVEDGASYAKFDLTPIPDSSIVILNAQLQCYQYQVNSRPVRTRCTQLRSDPDSISNEELYSAIRNGYVLAETSFSDIGWMGYELGSQGVSMLQGLLQQDWAALGIRSVTGEATSYGSNGDDRHARLRIVFADTSESDIQIVRAEPPYPLTRIADTALLVLMNRGLKPSEPFLVHATAPGLCPNSVLAAAIPRGQVAYLRLPMPVPDLPDTLVDYTIWTECANDPWVGDDTAKLSCWVFPPSTYAAEGFDASQFPPTGWVVVDNDGGGQHWQMHSDDSLVHSGAGFAMCIREPTRANDDWLISGPVCPRTDQPDSLGLFYRVQLRNSLMYLQTWAMRGQRIADTICCLTSGYAFDATYRRLSAPLDAFDGDTIFIGFRCQLSGGWNGLCLDDIWFSGFVPPDTSDTTDTTDTTVTPKPRDAVQRASTKLPDFALAPNPSGKRVITVRSALAVGKRRRVTMRDVVGRAVRTFVIDQSGIARLDLRGLAPGVYMATLDAGTQSLTRKLVITNR